MDGGLLEPGTRPGRSPVPPPQALSVGRCCAMSASRLVFALVVVVGVAFAVPKAAQAQPDSVRTQILEARGFSPDHSPRGALWRGAAVPGWGQVYNRQYYKLPFVYGGLAALGYAVYTMHQRYGLHQRAAIFARGQRLTNQEGDIPPVISEWQSYEGDYAEVVRRAGGSTDDLSTLPLSPSQLRQQRDKFRRWRDLSIVGTGLFYALTLVDAYVSAHLLTFDVGEDLAVRVHPTGGLPGRLGAAASARAPAGGNGMGLQIRAQF